MSQKTTFEIKCDRCGKISNQMIGWTVIKTVSDTEVWQPRSYDFCRECLKPLTATIKQFIGEKSDA